MRPISGNPNQEFNLGNRQRAKSEISALLKFTQTGKFKGIFLNAENEEDQRILWRGIEKLALQRRSEKEEEK